MTHFPELSTDRLALNGRTALVTGAGRGIGAACARLLAERGAQVILTDVEEGVARAAAQQLGNGAFGLVLDVRDPDEVTRVVEQVIDRRGQLDIAVNNAGVGVPNPKVLHETSVNEWRRVTAVNLDGVFSTMAAELRAMASAGHGSIVNIGSIAATTGVPGASAYVASKHAVWGLTRTAAVEYAGRGVRVNMVSPGYINTELSPRSVEQQAELAQLHPLGRLGSAAEVAEAVCFLASDAASFVTGSDYAVDGGFRTRWHLGSSAHA